MPKTSEAADQVAGSDHPKITRPRFAQVPIALLEACADRKGTLFIYAWLWHYAGQDDQAFPSINRLALECRMKPDDVRSGLRWLVENGWISRVDRVGQTTLFHVRYEQTPPLNGGPLPQKGDPPKGGSHPSPKRGTPPLPHLGDPNKRDLTRRTEQEVEPPLPPSGGNDAQQIEAFVMPTAAALPKAVESATVPEPPPPTKPVKTRSARFQPSHDLIPADLLPVHPEILGFWAVKAGSRSEKAWDGLITQLRLILQDPQGGTEALRGQLQEGINRAPIKPWMSVTHSLWRTYGLKGSAAAPGNRRITQTEAAAQAVAFFHAREAKKAAKAAAQGQQALLVEVVA